MKATFTLVLYLLVDACANAQAHQGDPKLTEIWSHVPRVINPAAAFHKAKKQVLRSLLFINDCLERELSVIEKPERSQVLATGQFKLNIKYRMVSLPRAFMCAY
jgi:hypothetical protein